GFDGGEKIFVVIIINVSAVFYKTERTNGSNKTLRIEWFRSAVPGDHCVNEFSRKFGAVAQVMFDPAKIAELSGRSEVYTRHTRPEPTGVDTQPYFARGRICIKTIEELAQDLLHGDELLGIEPGYSFGKPRWRLQVTVK